jgi:hypothetical protein
LFARARDEEKRGDLADAAFDRVESDEVVVELSEQGTNFAFGIEPAQVYTTVPGGRGR